MGLSTLENIVLFVHICLPVGLSLQGISNKVIKIDNVGYFDIIVPMVFSIRVYVCIKFIIFGKVFRSCEEIEFKA